MHLNIPTQVYDIYNNFVKEYCERTCILFFPSKLNPCPNCYQNNLVSNAASISIYRAGGPAPFSNGMPCPYCSGRGSLEEIESLEIPTRIYWKKSDFVPIPDNININSNSIQTYTDSIYLPQIERAAYLTVNYSGIENFKINRYYKKSPSYPTGFKDNPKKYIINIWGTDDN